jgi:hypothetical protein
MGEEIEGWKDGRMGEEMEGWKDGRMEGGKVVRGWGKAF